MKIAQGEVRDGGLEPWVAVSAMLSFVPEGRTDALRGVVTCSSPHIARIVFDAMFLQDVKKTQ